MQARSASQHLLALATTAVILLSACSPIASPTAEAPSPTPQESQTGDSISASVQVVPARSSELGFLISAPVDQLLVKEGDNVEAGQALITLHAPDLELAVTAAEQGLIAAQQNEFIQSQGRRKWDGFKFVWVAGPPEQRTAAHARVLQAQAQLAAAKARLEQSILRAPFAGTIVSIAVQPAEVVQPGQVVATVGDLAHLQVKTTDLSERDIARIRVGQPAQVTLDALAEPLTGSVAAIDPLAGRSADGDVTYTVTIEFPAQPSQILWGMTGSASIPAAP